jgi:Fe-S cluster biogenesis protein NfuA
MAGDITTQGAKPMYEGMSHSWRAKDGSRIRVAIEPSYTYSNVCRFIVEPPVYLDGAVHLSGKDKAAYSPLAQKIFELREVSEILVAGNTVTVTTAQTPDWEELSAKIASAIRDQVVSGKPSVSADHKKNLPPTEVIRERVQELIDTAIAPAVASHGGEVTLLDVRQNNVYLEFGGGCQGCGMAHVTLKYGVERLIRERIPEVGEILDTTDHAGGTNPYYSPSSR